MNELAARRAGYERHERIAALESQRLTLIAGLEKIDAEIAEAPRIGEIVVTLKKQRRSLIAALMKLDAEIVARSHGVDGLQLS